MEIKEILNPKLMIFDLKAKSKEGVLKELIHILKENGIVDDEEGFYEVVKKREDDFSTGIGFGLAIPHGKSTLVKKTAVVFGKSRSGIDFNSMDGNPAYIFFLIATPDTTDNIHLKILAELSRLLMHEEVRKALIEAETPEEVINAFYKNIKEGG